MKKILLLIVVLLSNAEYSVCCSCGGKKRISVADFNDCDWIFIGTLVKEIRPVREDNHHRTGVYKVVKWYKGVATQDTALVSDAENTAACGLGRMAIGRNYLIYARGTDKKWTAACSRTTQIPLQSWPRDSVFINKQKALTYFGKGYDTSYTNFYADTMFLNRQMYVVTSKEIQRFYDEHGKISAKGRYENGLPDGLWAYYKDGKVVSKGKYIKGKKDSPWYVAFDGKYFDENGAEAQPDSTFLTIDGE